MSKSRNDNLFTAVCYDLFAVICLLITLQTGVSPQETRKSTKRVMQNIISAYLKNLSSIVLIVHPSYINYFYSLCGDSRGLLKQNEALATKLGYVTYPIDEGLAVVYSELSDSNFRGIRISVGAGMTNVTVAYMATPIVSFGITRGGDWIDEQISIATGMAKERVTSIKETDFALGSEYEIGSLQGALAVYYDALLTYVLQRLKRKLSETAPHDAEFQVAIAGGSTRTRGFVEMFEKRLRETNLPIRVSSVKKNSFAGSSGTDSRDPIYAIARGCLIEALSKEASLAPAPSLSPEAQVSKFSAQRPQPVVVTNKS